VASGGRAADAVVFAAAWRVVVVFVTSVIFVSVPSRRSVPAFVPAWGRVLVVIVAISVSGPAGQVFGEG